MAQVVANAAGQGEILDNIFSGGNGLANQIKGYGIDAAMMGITPLIKDTNYQNFVRKMLNAVLNPSKPDDVEGRLLVVIDAWLLRFITARPRNVQAYEKFKKCFEDKIVAIYEYESKKSNPDYKALVERLVKQIMAFIEKHSIFEDKTVKHASDAESTTSQSGHPHTTTSDHSHMVDSKRTQSEAGDKHEADGKSAVSQISHSHPIASRSDHATPVDTDENIPGGL